MKKSLLIAATLVLSTSAFAAEKVIFDCSLGKFSSFEIVQSGKSWRYVEKETTRDRSGPGIYTKDEHTLLDTYNAVSNEIVEKGPKLITLYSAFNGQGGESNVVVVAEQIEGKSYRLTLNAKNEGPVSEQLAREWKEYVLDLMDSSKSDVICEKH